MIVENNGGNDRTAANLIVGHMPGIDQRPIIDPNAFKYLNSPHTPTKSREAEESRNFQPPKVIIPLKDVRIHEDQPVTFMTKIIGYPIPKVGFPRKHKKVVIKFNICILRLFGCIMESQYLTRLDLRKFIYLDLDIFIEKFKFSYF